MRGTGKVYQTGIAREPRQVVRAAWGFAIALSSRTHPCSPAPSNRNMWAFALSLIRTLDYTRLDYTNARTHTHIHTYTHEVKVQHRATGIATSKYVQCRGNPQQSLEWDSGNTQLGLYYTEKRRLQPTQPYPKTHYLWNLAAAATPTVEQLTPLYPTPETTPESTRDAQLSRDSGFYYFLLQLPYAFSTNFINITNIFIQKLPY